MNVYKQHPLSAAFPAMSALELGELTLDIKANGLRNPIVIFEDMVLDGWHRYLVCDKLGIYAEQVHFDEDDDPVAFVRSQNYHRRHMTGGQKAVAETELAKWAQEGRPKKLPTELGVSTEKQMAAAADVSVETIRQAKRVVEAGLADAVKAGEVSVKRAAEVAKLPEPERQAAIHAPKPKSAPKPRPQFPIANPAPGPHEVDYSSLRKQIDELKAQVEERDERIQELTKLLRDTEEENKSFGRVIEADDQLAAAMGEAKRFRELARVVEERNRGMQANAHALAKDAKRWMNKFLRLEREVKGQPVEPGTEEPEPSDEDLGGLFTEPVA